MLLEHVRAAADATPVPSEPAHPDTLPLLHVPSMASPSPALDQTMGPEHIGAAMSSSSGQPSDAAVLHAPLPRAGLHASPVSSTAVPTSAGMDGADPLLHATAGSADTSRSTSGHLGAVLSGGDADDEDGPVAHVRTLRRQIDVLVPPINFAMV